MRPYIYSLIFLLGVNAGALTLDEAIEKTLKTHPDAHAASLRYESAAAASISAESARYPRIDLNAAYYPTKTYVMPVSGAFSTKQSDGFHTDVTGVYSLWDFGRSKKKISAALSFQEGTQGSKNLTASELIEQVWVRYYGVAYAASLIEAAESSVKFYEGEYTRALNMRINGLKTEADALRFKASLLESRDRLESARNIYDKTRLSLALLAGEDTLVTGIQGSLDQRSNTIMAKEYTPELLRQELRERNPRLKVLSAAILQSKALSDAANTERYGEVMLVASAGHDNSLSVYNSYQTGIMGTIPLYDGGKLSAEAQKSRIAHSIALKEFESSERVLWQELYGAYLDLQHADETITAKEGVIEATGKTLRLIEERYKQGLATYLDVLEAQNTLDNGRTGLADAKYQKIRAYAQIQKLLNKGCDNDLCKN
ncbi:MAG: TolC family protein [Sulfuricurvum sp.]|uniref:TolC family protein n=1 Tax=Sulfuricurvum sp. TaxID=2025608 RepID=UPI002600E9D2|nr:TolC family protein [Sulfuricurvum sp.]MCK9372228.1 TolC family protein [Sulfuricurvum sp.]